MPDVVGYRDYVEHGDSVCSTLIGRWETYGPDRIESFPYPNGSKLRQLAVLRLPDLVALRAVGGRILTTVDPLLSDRVVSYRLESLGPAWGFRDPRASFARWRRRASAEILSGTDTAAWLTDVEAFFPSVSHHRLMAQLAAWGCDMDAATLLLRTLATWSKWSGLEGLPIGPEISSGIGNAFLMPVDDALEARGFTHFRYVDDIVVVGQDLSEEPLIDLIDGTLSTLGLRRSAEKTRYYRPGTALDAVDDALLAYLSRAGRGSREVFELAGILDTESDEQAPSRRRLNFALEGLRREGSPLAIASLLRAPGLLNVEPMTTCAYLRDFGVRLQPVRDLIIRTITETPSDETDALQLHCLSTAGSVA